MSASPELSERVFVYGTLRADAAQGSRMNGARFVGRGVVEGALYRVDWYPGVVLQEEGEVVGEVYEVDERQFAALDEYEGAEYRRVKADIRGEAAGEAWVWEWMLPTKGLERISSGDWLDRTSRSSDS